VGFVRRQGAERRRQRGASVVEFALTVPLFLVLLLGALEYGYYFYVAVTTTSAAREGARQCTLVSLGDCGSCSPTNAIAYMGKVGLSNKTTATSTCSNTDGNILYNVNVTVDFPSLSGFSTVLAAMPQSSKAGHVLAYGNAVMRGQ
jgi:Flp pilus assembly protein TadG